jgi:AraC-like DNA-binding protein
MTTNDPARPDPPRDPAIGWAWEQIHRSHGRVRIGALADEMGWSRRHLADRFRAEVGSTPKAFGRILRFRRAVELLTTAPYPSITEVAAACGFADHSHLVREFRSIAGCTPSELLGRGGTRGVDTGASPRPCA